MVGIKSLSGIYQNFKTEMVMAEKNSGKSILTGKKSTLSKKKLEEKKKVVTPKSPKIKADY